MEQEEEKKMTQREVMQRLSNSEAPILFPKRDFSEGFVIGLVGLLAGLVL